MHVVKALPTKNILLSHKNGIKVKKKKVFLSSKVKKWPSLSIVNWFASARFTKIIQILTVQ
jgi:hypothetical protein